MKIFPKNLPFYLKIFPKYPNLICPYCGLNALKKGEDIPGVDIARKQKSH
jgi:hypothetical protein